MADHDDLPSASPPEEREIRAMDGRVVISYERSTESGRPTRETIIAAAMEGCYEAIGLLRAIVEHAAENLNGERGHLWARTGKGAAAELLKVGVAQDPEDRDAAVTRALADVRAAAVAMRDVMQLRFEAAKAGLPLPEPAPPPAKEITERQAELALGRAGRGRPRGAEDRIRRKQPPRKRTTAGGDGSSARHRKD